MSQVHVHNLFRDPNKEEEEKKSRQFIQSLQVKVGQNLTDSHSKSSSPFKSTTASLQRMEQGNFSG